MFSRAGVGWVYEGFFGVDVPEDVDVDVVLVTHHHERHVAGARRARRVVINPIEYGMATDLERALRYAEVVLRRAGAPRDAKIRVSAAVGRGHSLREVPGRGGPRQDSVLLALRRQAYIAKGLGEVALKEVTWRLRVVCGAEAGDVGTPLRQPSSRLPLLHRHHHSVEPHAV